MASSLHENAGDVEPARVETNPGSSVKMQWGQVIEIDEAYLRASTVTKIWRSVLFQMVLFGA
jgi:hypothetical protein